MIQIAATPILLKSLLLFRTYTRYNFLADELTCLIISDQIAGGGWTAPH